MYKITVQMKFYKSYFEMNKVIRTASAEIPIDLRTARSDYGLYDSRIDCVSATNPKIYQFVAICGSLGS